MSTRRGFVQQIFGSVGAFLLFRPRHKLPLSLDVARKLQEQYATSFLVREGDPVPVHSIAPNRRLIGGPMEMPLYKLTRQLHEGVLHDKWTHWTTPECGCVVVMHWHYFCCVKCHHVHNAEAKCGDNGCECSMPVKAAQETRKHTYVAVYEDCCRVKSHPHIVMGEQHEKSAFSAWHQEMSKERLA